MLFAQFDGQIHSEYQNCKEKHLHRNLSEFDFRYSNRVTDRFVKLGSERHDGLFKKIGAPLSSFSSKIEISYAISNWQQRATSHSSP
jgi:hypothetical protein